MSCLRNDRLCAPSVFHWVFREEGAVRAARTWYIPHVWALRDAYQQQEVSIMVQSWCHAHPGKLCTIVPPRIDVSCPERA